MYPPNLIPRRCVNTRYAQLSKGRSFNSKSGRRMNITSDGVIHALILTNAMVTCLWVSAITRQRKVRMLTHFTTSYEHLKSGRYYTLLTCVFSHAQISHLLANMVGLYFSGRQVAQILGPKRFVYLYLSSGVLSSFAAVWEQSQSKKPILNLGASGAVNAIIAFSVLTFPHSMVYIFGILPMPAWLFGVLFIGKDFYGWFQQDSRIDRAQQELLSSIVDLQRCQSSLVSPHAEKALVLQRDVEKETVRLNRNVASICQRAVKWNTEQKRLETKWKKLSAFDEWALETEENMRKIAGYAEYVLAVISRES
ncbi:hypothetical protein ABG067_001085 [Albugo candida]